MKLLMLFGICPNCFKRRLLRFTDATRDDGVMCIGLHYVRCQVCRWEKRTGATVQRIPTGRRDWQPY